MLCSRCVLLLALYLLLDEISPAVIPSHVRSKREANWLDQDLFSRLPDQSNLSVGDAEDMIRHHESRPSYPESSLPSTERLSRQRPHLNQHKANEKRRKVAPVDSIGSFQMSNTRNRKDEPDVYWRDASK